MLRSLSLTFLLAFAACAGPRSFVEPIEAAHGAASWRAQESATAHFKLDIPGKHLMEGTLTTAPDGARTRIETTDGTVIVSTGSSVHVSPASEAHPKMRFHALTWSYFLAAPFKLADSGSHIEELGTAEFEGRTHDLARMTFSAGVGDAPDDWYVLYRDAESGRLSAMAYIVTFGKPAGSVTEADASAIVYRDFQDVDGVAVPMHWDFYKWSPELGPHGERVGQFTLSDFRFASTDKDTFSAPEGSAAVGLP